MSIIGSWGACFCSSWWPVLLFVPKACSSAEVACLHLECFSYCRPLCCDSLSSALTEPSPGLENNSFIFPHSPPYIYCLWGVELAPRCFQYSFLWPFPGYSLTAVDLLLLSREQSCIWAGCLFPKGHFLPWIPTSVSKSEDALALLCPHFTWEKIRLLLDILKAHSIRWWCDILMIDWNRWKYEECLSSVEFWHVSRFKWIKEGCFWVWISQ